MPLLHNAVFHTTVANLRDLPQDSRAEIAFAGRSNAGKSSAINTLAGRTRLAFVSKTPGRTQHLNYFSIGEGHYLVDLPGYGYAKAPEAIRRQWEGLVGPYLSRREELVGLVLIMDIRHPLTQLDLHLIDWFAPTGRPIHILLTKADKLGRQAQGQILHDVSRQLAQMVGIFSVQTFSSLKKSGIEDAESIISEWLAQPPETEIETEAPPPEKL